MKGSYVDIEFYDENYTFDERSLVTIVVIISAQSLGNTFKGF